MERNGIYIYRKGSGTYIKQHVGILLLMVHIAVRIIIICIHFGQFHFS